MPQTRSITPTAAHSLTPIWRAFIPETRLRKLLFLSLSALLHFCAFAPLGQFYLAWIALLPWLLVILTSSSRKAKFFFAWLGGTLSYLLVFIYLFRVTIPGAVALAMYLGLFWGLAGLLISTCIRLATRAQRPLQTRQMLLACIGTAAVFTACEWLRGVLLTGLPFLYVSHTQSPFLAICQIADVTGAYGITFIVLLVNAVMLLLICEGRRATTALGIVGVFIIAMVGYGVFRLKQDTTVPGPRVMVVQPNQPMKRGLKSVTQEQSVEFHLRTTIDALRRSPDVDLIVWNETTMPPLNPEVRTEPGLGDAPFLNQVNNLISNLCQQSHVAILTGGYFVGGWQGELGHRRATDIRNSAYLYNRNGVQSARYDKIHLVPFGEFIPFKFSIPWMFQVFLWLGPRTEEYSLTASDESLLTRFELQSNSTESWHFVTPICFEDLDAPLIREMIAAPDGTKRADFIVNITNDGWFPWNEKAQHLQAACFRCIEFRIPMARAVNTGISGFIDSDGRPHDLLGASAEGVSVSTLRLDARRTIYMRIGDLFAMLCVIAAGLVPIAACFCRKSPHYGEPTK